ncbi:hypothetical protein EYY60_14620 [Flavobacterium zhairuonense]|uniref:hypothetical protein n=1 Tax=Flavobacterium zhairuonense TaxID=2493631 RepID=UPI0010453CF8|nr:hypothetical protein [Flavobacterium zhairuonense]KAF2508361.1 hypothetical protein EYY60_14620 [Flavobacterium zhairuonense]
MIEKFKEWVEIGFIGFDLSDLDDTYSLHVNKTAYKAVMQSSVINLYKNLSDDYYSLLKRKTRSNIYREIFPKKYSGFTYTNFGYKEHKNNEFYEGYLITVTIFGSKRDEQKFIDFNEFVDDSILKVKTLIEQDENFDNFTFKIAFLNDNRWEATIHIYLFNLNKIKKLKTY